MLYVIDGKYYILSGGYYKEVKVVKNPKDKEDYNVEIVKNGKKIEATINDVYPQINYKDVVKKNSNTEIFG